MTQDLVQFERPSAETALGLWLSGFRSDATKRAYRLELMNFAAFTQAGELVQAISAFLALEDGPAHAIAAAWRQDKLRRGLSPASINRSISALNSFVAAARGFGATKLRLEARGEASRPYRDTKGPGVAGVRKLIQVAGAQKNARKALRDVAILKLAFGMGLRRGEIAGLDIYHVDLDGGTLSVMGKGRGEREPLTLPTEIGAAIDAWLEVRGEIEGAALFVGLSPGMESERITGSGVHHLVKWLGRKAGVKVRPHGLRHSAVTAALDVFDGDYRKVRGFSRHKSLDIIQRYDDNRADHGGQVAAALSAIVAK